MSTEAQVHTGVRLPKAFLARVDKLADRMSRPGLLVTRAEILRLAAFKGLDQLEAENKRPSKKGRGS